MALTDTAAHRLPSVVRTLLTERWMNEQFELSLVALPAPFPGFAVYPDTLWPRSGMPASWRRSDAGDDSLMIAWTTGFHGIELRVDPRGDSLVGRAQPSSDARVRGEAPPPEADVVAVRIPCNGGR